MRFQTGAELFELQDRQHARMLPMEGLRGAAVTLVFLQHFAVQAQLIGLASAPTAWLTAELRSLGNLGVDLFFVLSGYLIYGTMIRKAPPFLAFMRRRLERIYPAFLVMFALTLLAVLAAGMGGKIPEQPGAATLYLAANLLLLPGLLPIEPLMSVAWSLSYEMFFYVVTAVAVRAFRLQHVAARSRIIGLLLLAAGFYALALADIRDYPIRMLPFFAGMLLAEGLGRHVPVWLGGLAPLAATLLAMTHLVSDPNWNELIWSAGFFALCGVAFREQGRLAAALTWTPLRWIGNMSYSVYLAHGFITRAAMVVLATILPSPLPDAIVGLLLLTLYAASLTGGAILFATVEKPLSLHPRTPQPVSSTA